MQKHSGRWSIVFLVFFLNLLWIWLAIGQDLNSIWRLVMLTLMSGQCFAFVYLGIDYILQERQKSQKGHREDD